MIPSLGVLYRVVQRVVSVEGDGAQVEDGGRAAEDVGGQPHLAHHAAEDPPAQDVVDDVEGQHADGDGQVGGGQTHDEEVGGDFEGGVGEDADDDEDVADDGDDDDGGEGEDGDEGLPLGHGELGAEEGGVVEGAVHVGRGGGRGGLEEGEVRGESDIKAHCVTSEREILKMS